MRAATTGCSLFLEYMREQTQLRIIQEILEGYRGKEPFSRYLKKYFNVNRQLGSRDRRLIQEFTFNYFRIGRMFSGRSPGERLALAALICKAEGGPLFEYVLRGISNTVRLTSQLEPDQLFPYGRHLSDSISKAEFIHSFLVQPRVWIRVRGEFTSQVEAELHEKGIGFDKDPELELAWSFKNATSLDQLDSFKKGYFEIQDRSSQKTLSYILPKPSELWWDACAGSGGKSLMMAASVPEIKLFCTDSRETILQNLEKRFAKADVRNFKTRTIDLVSSRLPSSIPAPNGIVADVPCTGSGTWARTPEWLTFFDLKSIGKFQELQRKIVSNTQRLLPDNKPFVYITCSVFKEENEENTSWISSNLPLKLQTQLYIEGASKGADTMFVARFIKA
jgi:16S rRNA (cytosine967-C5)-methyltransferase